MRILIQKAIMHRYIFRHFWRLIRPYTILILLCNFSLFQVKLFQSSDGELGQFLEDEWPHKELNVSHFNLDSLQLANRIKKHIKSEHATFGVHWTISRRILLSNFIGQRMVKLLISGRFAATIVMAKHDLLFESYRIFIVENEKWMGVHVNSLRLVCKDFQPVIKIDHAKFANKVILFPQFNRKTGSLNSNLCRPLFKTLLFCDSFRF